MLSRVADAIYWMNRYVERAENVARFVDVNLHLALDFPEAGEQWEPLVATTGDNELFRKKYGEGHATRDNVLDFLTFDRESPNSIVSCLQLARENARSVREIISSEMWEQVNHAYLMVTEAARTKAALDTPHDFFTEVKQASHQFVGTTYLTMSHTEAWHFGRLGRLLERADKTSRILDVKYFLLLPQPSDVGTTLDALHWSALLRSASAFEMFRKKFHTITPNKVVEYLLLDRKFPRSVFYCLSKAERSLHAITGAQMGTWTNGAERELGRLNSELSYADTREILGRGLHEYIDNLQQRLNYVGQSVFETFFAMKEVDPDETRSRPPPPLSSTGLGDA
ncbi:MAG: alpha-E domain-containing protein [Labilithrix sp.]|nr:alpha-E domain-containing protein [Labilithrix sp.]MCW5813628.1 alpha-E domain-containing protein [Labilithrix sp.]